jgi:hypothetical protein
MIVETLELRLRPTKRPRLISPSVTVPKSTSDSTINTVTKEVFSKILTQSLMESTGDKEEYECEWEWELFVGFMVEKKRHLNQRINIRLDFLMQGCNARQTKN